MSIRRCLKHDVYYHNHCQYCRAEQEKEEKRAQIEREAIMEGCKGCVWLKTDGGVPFCPFARCVERKGFIVVDPHGDGVAKSVSK